MKLAVEDLPCVHRGSYLKTLPCCGDIYQCRIKDIRACAVNKNRSGIYACDTCGCRAETKKAASLIPPVPVRLGDSGSVRVTRPEPTEAITACVTEFNRPESLKRLLASLADRFPSLKVDVEPTGGNLSAARNRLADRCRTPFYFMLEEDFVVDSRTSLASLLDVMAAEPNCGGVSAHTDEPKQTGTDNRGRKIWWDRDFSWIGEKVFFVAGRRPVRQAAGTRYRNCDLVLNFGLFRTEMLRTIRYDERIPIGSEHVDFFWRAYRDGRWHFAHVPQVMALHMRDRPGPEYNKPRRRVFPKYLRRKHGVEFIRWAPGPDDVASPNDLALPNVVFLTMGCSNSTILSQMAFSALGFNAGDLDEQYQEERRVRRINENILRAGRPFPVDMRRALRRIPQPWLIKDPRFRKTLSHWIGEFEEFRPLLLYVVKDEASVRASYQRHGWRHDPADPARCEAGFAAWPWKKLRLQAEDLSQAMALWDPSRVKLAGSRRIA